MGILAINWLFVAMPDKPIIITIEIVIDHFQDGMDGRTDGMGGSYWIRTVLQLAISNRPPT